MKRLKPTPDSRSHFLAFSLSQRYGQRHCKNDIQGQLAGKTWSACVLFSGFPCYKRGLLNVVQEEQKSKLMVEKTVSCFFANIIPNKAGGDLDLKTCMLHFDGDVSWWLRYFG